MLKKLKKWVLLAEDDTDVLDLYESYLELHYGESLRVIRAIDGVEATNRLPFQAFDLIVTDLNMPRKSGQAFIKAVKESQMNENTPIVVISGEEDTDINIEQLTLLTKPVNQETFIKCVEDQLKLGKTDQRVAAELLNTFIDAAKNLVIHTTAAEVEQKAPVPKKEREGVHGDFFRLINVKVGNTKNQFLFGFEMSLIKKMCEKYNKSGDEAMQTIVGVAGDLISKHSIRKIGATHISITGQETIEKSGEGYEDLFKIKGILIPLQCEHGHLNVYAMWK